MNPSAFSHVLCSLVPATFLLSIVCVRMVPSSGSVSGSGRISSKFRLPTKKKRVTKNGSWTCGLSCWWLDLLFLSTSISCAANYHIATCLTVQHSRAIPPPEKMQRSEDEEGSHVTRVTTGNPRWLDVILWKIHTTAIISYIIYILYISYWKKARISIVILVDWRVTKNQRPSAV